MVITVSNNAVQLSQSATTILQTKRDVSNEEMVFRAQAFKYICQMCSDVDNLHKPVEWILGELKANNCLHKDQNLGADIILGMAQAIPHKKLQLTEAILGRDDYLDYNIDGIVVGLFEMCSVGEPDFHAELKLFEALATGGVTSRLCDTKSTNFMRGRLSGALVRFITPAWKNGSLLSYRLTLISALNTRLASLLRSLNCDEPDKYKYFHNDKAGYNIPAPTTPMTCIELLCEEMTKRFLIESGLSFRMDICSKWSFDVPEEFDAKIEEFEKKMLRS